MNTRELVHFLQRSHYEQRNAIRRLAALGCSEATIACARQLSVEMLRRVLLEFGKALA